LRVELNGIELDVLPIGIRPTYESNNLNEIQNRNLSNATLKFPKTPRNAEFFDFLDYQGSESSIPYDIVKCVIYVKNEVHLKGVCKIRRTVEDYYEGIVKEDAGNIFDLIKDKDLKDLDFSDINHYLNNTTYTDGVDNITGHVYGLADFGSGFDNPLQVARQSPSLFKHYLWTKIFAEAGVLYQGDIFDSAEYKHEVISMAKGHVDVGKVLNDQDSQGYSENYQTPANGTYTLVSTFNTEVNSDDNRVDAINDTTIRFNYPCKIRIVGSFSGGANASPANQNYSLSYSNYFAIDLNNAPTIYTYNGTSTSEDFTEYVIIEAGDTIQFEATTTAVINEGLNFTISNALSNIYVEIIEPYIDFSDLIGDISQTAFVKDLIKSLGMMFRIVPPLGIEGASADSLVYDFTTMESVLNDRNGAEDWSDKRGVKIESKKDIGSYGVNNRFKYKYSEGITPFLDYDHVSTNLNQQGDNTIIESVYEVSELRNSFEDTPTINPVMFELVRVERYEEDEDGNEYLASYNQFYKSLQIENRTSKVKFYNKTYDIIDGGSGTATINQLVQYLTNTNVEWEFYWEEYFEAFTRIIDKPNKVKMALYLTPLDIKNRDFFKLKYFNQEGRYYYLNKIINFREGYNTVCELIEVKGFEAQFEDCSVFKNNNYVIPTYDVPEEDNGGGDDNPD